MCAMLNDRASSQRQGHRVSVILSMLRLVNRGASSRTKAKVDGGDKDLPHVQAVIRVDLALVPCVLCWFGCKRKNGPNCANHFVCHVVCGCKRRLHFDLVVVQKPAVEKVDHCGDWNDS